eukprot:scaffold10728_cov153-Amphora_coffeaeformis.AAC.1
MCRVIGRTSGRRHICRLVVAFVYHRRGPRKGIARGGGSSSSSSSSVSGPGRDNRCIFNNTSVAQVILLVRVQDGGTRESFVLILTI